MKFEEFMKLSPGDLVIVSGQYLGQVTKVETFKAGEKCYDDDGSVFVYSHNIRSVTVEYAGYGNAPVVFSPFVYTDYGTKEIHNRIALARLELWKGE